MDRSGGSGVTKREYKHINYNDNKFHSEYYDKINQIKTILKI